MKRLNIFLIILAQYFITTSTAMADEAFYISAGSGVAFYDTGVTATTGTAHVDDATDTSRLLVGLGVGLGLTAEAYYTDLGEVTVTANAGDTLVQNGAITTFASDNTKLLSQYKGYGINAVYKVDLGPVGFYAKAGILHWSLEYEASVAGTVFSNRTDSGDELLLGVGFEYSLLPFVSMRIDYEQTEIDDYDVMIVGVSIAVEL